MRKAIYLLTLCTALLTSCTGGRQARRTPQPSDTLYTVQKAMSIYSEKPEQALMIIDSAEVVNNIDDFHANLLRARIYAFPNSIQNLDTARQICMNLLQHDSAKAKSTCQFNVLEQLTTIARLKNDDKQQLHWATQLANLCYAQGWKAEALRTEAEIGVVMTRLGQYREGVAKLDDVIGQLNNIRHFNELDASIIAMKRKINVLNKADRCAEIIPVAERIIERLDDYEQHPADYADASYREPASDEERARYCKFYRSQAYGFLANAYAIIGGRGGDFASARKMSRHYADLFGKTVYGQTYNGREIISSTWRNLGEYDKMLAIYDEMAQRMGADTLNPKYADMLKGRAMAAHAKGQNAQGYDYMLRYASLSQQLNDSLQASEAHAYAARYHAQEQQMEIERRDALVRLNATLARAGLLIAMAAIAFVIYLVRQRRLVDKKNRILARQINEAISYKEKYEELRDASSTRLHADEREAPKHDENADGRMERADLSTLSDDELFQFFSRTIVSNQLFLDPSFDRQQLIDRFHLSKDRIGSAFSKGSNYVSLAAFVNDCRLEHAVRLLTEDPALSIEKAALASGYTSGNTFGRNFKARYGMSPTEFRKGQK